MEENETEKLKNESVLEHKNGGIRPGAGRPKGSENAKTRMKRMKLQEVKRIIEESAQMLVHSQLQLAKGVSQLYHSYYIGEGKNKKKVVEVVTDQSTIEAYLREELDEDGYFFISTEKPDNRAIANLLDRAFGKPKESVEVDDKRRRRVLRVEIIDGRQQTEGQIPSEPAV